MAEPTRQPAFFCPQCQQKHRADLTPLEKRPGAVMRTVCRGCKSKLLIRMEAGAPLVEVESPPEAPESLGGPYEAAVDLKPGTKAGRYEIQGLTRQGRMSTVYRAHDPETKRTVGLNVLHADAPQDQRDRFRHQVEVQGGIRHPNVLPVYDRGELADRRPFFAAEHLHEPLTLGEILTRSRSGDLEDDDHLGMLGSTRGLVEHVLLPIAEGVYVANIESEVAHRDLRPENIVVDGRTGRPYLNEFGFAASLEAGAAKPLTLPLSPYVAPETAAGHVHPRTDVWGLGALLHLLLSGEAPIEGHGRALLDAVRKGRMRELPDDADPALSAIARKASAPDPEQRYVNARQLAADLRAWLQGRAVRAVDTFGDRGAHKEEVRAALRRGAKVALWGVVGLAVGLLVGSQIRLRGEGGIAPGLAAASSEVDRLVREVDALAERADRLSIKEGSDVWSDVLRRTTDLDARLSSQEEGETRSSLEGRLDFVRARFDTHLLLSLPDGVSVRIRNALTGEERSLASTDGPIQLGPGLYDVRNAGGQPLRFPILAGLHVRRAGSRGEGPRIHVAVPDAMTPAGAVLVVEGEVPSRAPWTRPGRRLHVPAFFLDRHPVSNEAYSLFLGALPPEQRESHLPAMGFTWNPEQQTASVESGKGGEPVQGLSPRDAEAYCAWRSKEEGRPVTLPDENQWMLAAGAALMPDDPRCEGLEIPDTPYGAFGLRTGPLELARTADGDGKADYVSKGMRGEEDSPASTVFSREAVGADQRGAVTFRCARKIVATP